MSLLTKILKMKAVYWEKDSIDNYGQPTYKTPVEIGCRWEEIMEEFVTAEGTREVSKAKIYVGDDMKTGGLLLLGELASGMTETNAKDYDVFEIRAFYKIPDIRCKKYVRFVYL
jgi:hypothetical protein